ncbi:MAG: phosphatase PAP2 family protein [Solirubrobacterales bacterium]
MDARISRPLVAAAGGVALLAAVLVAAYYVGPLARWDATAVAGLRALSDDHRSIWLISHAIALTANIEPVLLTLGVLCVAGVAWGRQRQVAGAVALVAAAGIATWLLKIAAAHPRYQPVLSPDQLDPIAFPSGHATAAMSLSLAAVIVVPGRWRRLAGILGAGYALTVAIALMVAGWHFPSDVLGGFLIAGSLGMVVLAALRAAEGGGERVDPVQQEGQFAFGSFGVRPLELLVTAIALGVGALALTRADELASYAASHTTAVLAAVAVAAGAAGVVYGVAAELETR